MASSRDNANDSAAKNTKGSDIAVYTDVLIEGLEALKESERMAKLNEWISKQQGLPWLAKIDEASRNQLIGYASKDEVRQWLLAFDEKERAVDEERVSDVDTKLDEGQVKKARKSKKPLAKKDVSGVKAAKRTAKKTSTEKVSSRSAAPKAASNDLEDVSIRNEASPHEQGKVPMSPNKDASDAVGVESSAQSEASVVASEDSKSSAPVEKSLAADQQAADEYGVIESESSEGEDAEQTSDASLADEQSGERQSAQLNHTKWQRVLFWMDASAFDALIKAVWVLAQSMNDEAAIEAFYREHHTVLNGVGDNEMSLFVQSALNFDDQEAFKRNAYDRLGAYLLRPVSEEETIWFKKQWATLRLDVDHLPEKAEHAQGALSVRRLENGGGSVSFSMHWSSDGASSDQDPYDGHASSWSKASMDKAYMVACWLHDQGCKRAVLASNHRQLARNMWAIATINNLEMNGFNPHDEDRRWLDKARESLEQRYKVSFDHTLNAVPGLGKGAVSYRDEAANDEAND